MKNLTALLRDARQNKVAIGAFNVYSYETIRGVLDAAIITQLPVIIAFGESYLMNMRISEVAALVGSMKKNCPVPVGLHLDHAKSLENIEEAIFAGFTSVMFDGSALSFEENVQRTQAVVKLAHAKDVSVEAELGSIGAGLFSNEEAQREEYTDPEQAREFVKRTAADALAVSVGTVHGMYKGEPRIAVDVLRRIAEFVEIPLVLHGGSGTPVDILEECIGLGIAKINVNTEISVSVLAEIEKRLLAEPKPHLSQLSLLQVQAVTEVAKRFIQILTPCRKVSKSNL